MNTLFSRYKWMRLVYGLLLVVAGALIIAVAVKAHEQLSTWLSIICAVTLFIFGACTVFSSVFDMEDRYFSIAYLLAAVAIALGVVMCCHTDFIGQVITTFVSVVFITLAVVQFGKAAALIYYKKNKASVAFFFVVGAVVLALGVLSLIFSEVVEKIIYFLCGAIIVLFGVVEILRGTYFAFKGDSEEKAKKEKRFSIKPAKTDAVEPESAEVTVPEEPKAE